jgi:hypothetical protein
MMIKVAFATVAAAALCAPAMAPATTTSAPTVSNVAFSVPMKHHHHNNGNCNGGINVCGNSVQVPIQACNNNILSNNGIGILGIGKSSGGSNKGKCSQNTSSNH